MPLIEAYCQEINKGKHIDKRRIVSAAWNRKCRNTLIFAYLLVIIPFSIILGIIL